MGQLIKFANINQRENASIKEKTIIECKAKFDEIFSYVLDTNAREAHKVEASIFKKLLELGFHLLNLYFMNQNRGDYGKTVETQKGIAIRGRLSMKSYFSIFGKLEILRYLYNCGDESFAILDEIINLPTRCYSYFLSEFTSLLDLRGAYKECCQFLERFFGLNLSVAAAETIAKDSSQEYKTFYDDKNKQATDEQKEDFVVVSFDGKGVPMIKKEAAKIKGRPGKGEKRQKKKEALVGVKYDINTNVRTAEEVANNLVYPENKEDTLKPQRKKAQNIRYIASIEQPKREVMEEIKQSLEKKDFSKNPLICVMDGARSLWKVFQEVFKEIENKVFILDIIHVLEYIWLIAHVKYKEGSLDASKYVYEKLLEILNGNIASYIMELQEEIQNCVWKKSQKATFKKVITYLKNNRAYMHYDQYLSKGYPIGTGVVESACNHVVKERMELSGARWGINGAEAILRLRSVVKSNDWDAYWEFYTSQKYTENFSIKRLGYNVQFKVIA